MLDVQHKQKRKELRQSSREVKNDVWKYSQLIVIGLYTVCGYLLDNQDRALRLISVIIIAKWHLHVQVCTFDESTEMKAHCIVIQGMPTGNSRKSRDTMNGHLKTSGHKTFKEITASLLLITEFNEMSMTALQT